MRHLQIIYVVLNVVTGKIIYRSTSKAECKEYLKTMSNKDELKVGYQWKII